MESQELKSAGEPFAEAEAGTEQPKAVVLKAAEGVNDVFLYDALANQSIPFLLETEAGLVQVEFVVSGQTDEVLIEQERRRNLRLKKAELADTGGIHGIEAKSEKVKASAELFDTVALPPKGFGESDDDVPANWKELIEEGDKADVMDLAYLACEVLKPQVAVVGTRVPWNYRRGTKTHTLRALFNGFQVVLTHTLGPANDEQLAEFKSIMGQHYQVQGTMIMQGETLIPPRLKRLGKLYKQLHQEHTGYVGWPPLHHQAEIVQEHLAPVLDAVRKNSNASQPQ